MKILPKVIMLLFLAVFAVNAQENQDLQLHPHMRTSVYLHPVALLAGLNAKIPLIYVTVENPLSLYNALIVKPSVWASADGYRIGSDLGIRHYPAGRGEGMYLSLQAGGFYLSVDDIEISFDFDFGEETKKKRNKNSAWWFDAMGYFGYSYKYAYISIYSDTGVGYGCVAGTCSLMFDLNFGIGIPF